MHVQNSNTDLRVIPGTLQVVMDFHSCTLEAARLSRRPFYCTLSGKKWNIQKLSHSDAESWMHQLPKMFESCMTSEQPTYLNYTVNLTLFRSEFGLMTKSQFGLVRCLEPQKNIMSVKSFGQWKARWTMRECRTER